MILRSRNVFVALGACLGVSFLVIACGSDGGSEFDPEKQPQPGFTQDGGFNGDSSIPQEDLYKNDPPPQWCGPDGGPAAPPAPTGTEDCPSDKNKPGCACTKPGDTAACWTGLRKHRNLGICKDGVTTCRATSETSSAWGPCEGQVLPDPNATRGAAACGCFSEGQWKIANLTPCVSTWTDAGGAKTFTATSTLISTGKCGDYSAAPATTKPAEEWSTDTLKVDCAGTFELCYRIRAGSFEAPSPNDCVLGEICAPKTFYEKPGVEQTWPNLGSWIGADKACAAKWAGTPETASAGYGEMIVKGESVLCDKIDDGSGNPYVFNRIKYCPRVCQTQPTLPDCVACQQSGQGTFN